MTSGSPMSERESPRPVPAVRLIVQDRKGRVLVLRRPLGATAGGAWCLPGGKIDYGNTVEAAAARELAEETALRATRLRFLFYQDSLPLEHGGMHCINLYLLCETEGDLKLNEESTEAAWIGPGDLAGHPLAFRNDEGIRRFWAHEAP